MPAADVPRDPADILPWVDDVWADVDAWIEAENVDGAVLPVVTLEPTPEAVPGIPVAPVVMNPQEPAS